MSLIQCMSLAGMVPLFICCFLWLMLKGRLDIHLANMLLKTSIFFFLVPVQILKYFLPQRALDVVGNTTFSEYIQIKYNNIETISIRNEYIWIPKYLKIVSVVWIIVVVLFVVCETVKYRYAVKFFYEHSYPTEITIGRESKNVYVCKYARTPYTIGIINPKIVFPPEYINHECTEMLYLHESAHIKNKDSLIRMICLIIICIHCFNPFSILLLVMHNLIAESICDEYACNGHSVEDRKRFSSLLIQLSTSDDNIAVVWKNNFSTTKNVIKRRIMYIMQEKRNSKTRRGVATVVIILAVFASCATTYAYSAMQSSSKVLSIGDNDDFVTFGSKYIEEWDFTVCDTFFEDKSGNIIYSMSNDASTYAFCIHNFKSGTVTKHVKNNSGGCTIYVYNGRICTKCNYIEEQDLVNTITYKVCTH